MRSCGPRTWASPKARVVIDGAHRPARHPGPSQETRLHLTDLELNQAYTTASAVADKKQEVFDEDLIAILHDEIIPCRNSINMDYLHIYSGTAAIPTATVRVRLKDGVREGARPLETARWMLSARLSHGSRARRNTGRV